MLLKDIILIIDPIKILPADEAEFLLNSDSYEEAWKDIKRRHKITTNVFTEDRFAVSDIYYFHKNLFEIGNKDIPDEIPNIKTDSGYLVGIEFKDLKKFNNQLDDNDDSIFDGAFATRAFKSCVVFGSDMDGEYVSALISVPNVDYDPNDEKSSKNISYYLEWENSYVEENDEDEDNKETSEASEIKE